MKGSSYSESSSRRSKRRGNESAEIVNRIANRIRNPQSEIRNTAFYFPPGTFQAMTKYVAGVVPMFVTLCGSFDA